MTSSLDRRNVLLALAGLPAAGLLLSGCDASDAKSPTAQATDMMTTSATSADAPPAEGSVDVQKLMQPGALPDMQLGKDDAKVTIVEYASMTCPHCAHFDVVTLPELKKKAEALTQHGIVVAGMNKDDDKAQTIAEKVRDDHEISFPWLTGGELGSCSSSAIIGSVVDISGPSLSGRVRHRPGPPGS